ncbi:MAG: phycobilisome rod-core linker polypeptide, partial [Cyanobacteria bacterium J06641_5]
MALPLLDYAPTTQNQRVRGFEVLGDEQPRTYNYVDGVVAGADIDAIVWAAYRQIYNEQQMLRGTRQLGLESQLRAGQLTIREFIRGLALSEPFRRNYESNNNYRFAQMCVQRLLGREVYGESEKRALSIILATQGLQGFIDTLLSSEEYLENFGDHSVPYQRRRVLPQRDRGDVSFAHFPRYGADRLTELKKLVAEVSKLL